MQYKTPRKGGAQRIREVWQEIRTSRKPSELLVEILCQAKQDRIHDETRIKRDVKVKRSEDRK